MIRECVATKKRYLISSNDNDCFVMRQKQCKYILKSPSSLNKLSTNLCTACYVFFRVVISNVFLVAKQVLYI